MKVITEWSGVLKLEDVTKAGANFTLDGKYFFVCDNVLPQFKKLNGETITLIDSTEGDHTFAAFCTNGDHHFIESLKKVGPNKFSIYLGS
jgi:hypothetical protein